ncbi:heat-shock protein Hsp20 [Bacillus sp. V3-13]|uniref:Hsp20/alpha crystallin family protein n=1 Tax=Bacillus sp. V3-13 TaxID=2053728 RepID=UPI000C791EAE|nr:Hsp20/alpha crystallin family protein [Bacillus sp. V3-13]PLR79449.1 heat-shock protein Hsp20 [Bacillus sp. V3-13]
MSLIPFEPFRHLDNMRRELNHFFSSDFPSLTTGFNHDFGVPKIDVYETENEVVATCDIPGLEKKEDVNINIDTNVLSISGTINRENEVKEENIHRKERFSGRFQRTISLPSRVSTEGDAKATYKNGILEIRMRKLNDENGNQKKIDVEFH